MGQPASQAVPSTASAELDELLEGLRPWTDEKTVEKELRAWATRRSISLAARADWAGDIAAHLRAFGTGTAAAYLRAHKRDEETEDLEDRWRLVRSRAPGRETVLGLVWHMLGNVGRGRGATDDDLLGDHVLGLSKHQLRHYRRVYKDDALFAYLRRLQRRIDQAALVRRGWPRDTARKWLLRHPGRHAHDAPPKPRSGTPTAAAGS